MSPKVFALSHFRGVIQMETVTHVWKPWAISIDLKAAGFPVENLDRQGQELFAGIHKETRTRFAITDWEYQSRLRVIASRDEKRLVDAFSRILGVNPLHRYKDVDGWWIFEWWNPMKDGPARGRIDLIRGLDTEKINSCDRAYLPQ